jgi:NAD(P)-dependent dehydrogenase (short-subunit alcohol dehydrogenase family)
VRARHAQHGKIPVIDSATPTMKGLSMHITFTGRKVLITGSSAGIGFATAQAFVAAGASVVVNGRSQASVDAAVARLGGAQADVSGFAGDLSTAQGCVQLVAAHPAVDVLINNLGVFGPQDFFETPDSEWERFFQTNVMSGVRLAKAYAPGMVAKG